MQLSCVAEDAVDIDEPGVKSEVCAVLTPPTTHGGFVSEGGGDAKESTSSPKSA